jgi:hypothetical protein
MCEVTLVRIIYGGLHYVLEVHWVSLPMEQKFCEEASSRSGSHEIQT